ADVIILLAVLLVVLGWLVLYWTGAPAGVIETGRGGVKLTLGSLQDWLVRIPRVFNSTTLGLDVLSINFVGIGLVFAIGLVAPSLFRGLFAWLLPLCWRFVLIVPTAALFPADEMIGYLQVTFLSMPVRYFYYIIAGSGLWLVASGVW